MPRLFFKVQYKGTRFSGFQVQQNAHTVQKEVEVALKTLTREQVDLTGSSRTDAGVHAIENYFHADVSEAVMHTLVFSNSSALYNLNAILSRDLVLKRIFQVCDDAHSRFDAISRTYEYSIQRTKNPFNQEYAFFYPFDLDITLLKEAAAIIATQTNFIAFSKKHTQVLNFNCVITESIWIEASNDKLIYRVTGSRFLRGMVKALVGTMLLVGRKKMTLQIFQKLFTATLPALADFTPPSSGLCLMKVTFSEKVFIS